VVVRELLGKLKGLMDILVTWEPLKMVSFPYYPLPGTNIAPETVGLEDEFPFKRDPFLFCWVVVSKIVYFHPESLGK